MLGATLHTVTKPARQRTCGMPLSTPRATSPLGIVPARWVRDSRLSDWERSRSCCAPPLMAACITARAMRPHPQPVPCESKGGSTVQATSSHCDALRTECTDAPNGAGALAAQRHPPLSQQNQAPHRLCPPREACSSFGHAMRIRKEAKRLTMRRLRKVGAWHQNAWLRESAHRHSERLARMSKMQCSTLLQRTNSAPITSSFMRPSLIS